MPLRPEDINPNDVFTPEFITHAFKGGNIPCRLMHDHTCEYDAILRFIKIFKAAFKFYAPIHLIPVIIFKLKRIKKQPWKVIKGYLKNVFQSCMFLSVYMTILKYGMCIFRNLLGNRPLSILLAGVISFPGMFFEAPGRRTEMSLYFLSPFLESVWRWLDKRGYPVNIPNGEVYLFCTCVAIIMYCYERHPDTIKSTYRSLLSKLWGDD
ncbi:unnamed protein product [Moneuplotes crassus]|uniref:Transmembrane protein 135 N-terminal domain-containing protein n=1 Tax=Euplotes crassus TaxID=5936 RepID=A0AAD1XWB9_EUPCR|nr:unnamed protein product [Moneuplotes crassus]